MHAGGLSVIQKALPVNESVIDPWSGCDVKSGVKVKRDSPKLAVDFRKQRSEDTGDNQWWLVVLLRVSVPR